ncbi:MAG: protein phosphatase [Planctomycetaceae bacterium]
MRQIAPHALWLGHLGDVRDWRAVFAAGIQAIIDLAGNEAPAVPPRDLIYQRFPLVDGAGNPDWLLKLACHTVADLLSANIPTLVYCSAGMSRSPIIAAAAIALATNRPLDEAMTIVRQAGQLDVSPALWAAVGNCVTILQDD